MARKLRKVAKTRNVRLLENAYQAVRNRPAGDPGIILVYGEPGYGKTTAGCSLFIEERGVLVTALPGSTQKSLVDRLLFEVGAEEPARSTAKATEQLINALASKPRPVFVDELDLLFYNTRALETLRLVHDLTTCPLILIGMTGVERQVLKLRQLASRISRKCEFGAADLDDARLVAEAACTVGLGEVLLKRLFEASAGNLRDFKVGLSRIEEFGNRRGLEAVGLDEWVDRQFFFREGMGS